jgi:hypothetical protein
VDVRRVLGFAVASDVGGSVGGVRGAFGVFDEDGDALGGDFFGRSDLAWVLLFGRRLKDAVEKGSDGLVDGRSVGFLDDGLGGRLGRKEDRR